MLGFQPQAIEIMASFLGNRSQFVQLEGQRSEKLEIGPFSVIQGSTMSCILFLIYILDMPLIFHDKNHSPEEYRECKRTNLKTFVDDSYLKTYKEDDKTMEETIRNTMDKVLQYTKANKLSVNPDKTQIMLQTTNNKIKDDFSIVLNGKTIRHKNKIMVLGNLLSDTLTWDNHVSSVLILALKNRIQTLKLVSKFMDKGFCAVYTNSIFRSQLMFGIETWGGAQKTLINKVQLLQDKASKLALVKQHHNLSARQRQKLLGWLPIQTEIQRATNVMTFKILNTGKPEEIATQMKINNKTLRIKEHRKLDTQPRWLGNNKVTKASYRARAYVYNTLPKELTQITELKKFKRNLKNHYNLKL